MPEHNLYLNHLFKPLAVGSLVEMHLWPEHVTLASNFFTNASLDTVRASLRSLFADTSEVKTSVVGEAAFGEAGEFRVSLLDYTAPFMLLQERLVEFVEGLPGYFETPKFAGAGYRPHTTIQPGGTSLEIGSTLRIDSATLFDIDAASNTRTVLENFAFNPAA